MTNILNITYREVWLISAMCLDDRLPDAELEVMDDIVAEIEEEEREWPLENIIRCS